MTKTQKKLFHVEAQQARRESSSRYQKKWEGEEGKYEPLSLICSNDLGSGLAEILFDVIFDVLKVFCDFFVTRTGSSSDEPDLNDPCGVGLARDPNGESVGDS
jgi:hypothetical protein